MSNTYLVCFHFLPSWIKRKELVMKPMQYLSCNIIFDTWIYNLIINNLVPVSLLKSQYRHVYSPCCSPFIFYSTSLAKKVILHLVIISSIFLMVGMFDQGETLQREITLWLLRLKRLHLSFFLPSFSLISLSQ